MGAQLESSAPMPSPWRYSESSSDRLGPARLLYSLFPKLRRGGRGSLSSNHAGPKLVRPPGLGPHTRQIALADAAEADLLTTAFFRYVELHGRVACDPMSRCALATSPSRRPGRARTVLVTLWSARAAAEFDRFWTSYRRVYGGRPDYVLSPAA